MPSARAALARHSSPRVRNTEQLDQSSTASRSLTRLVNDPECCERGYVDQAAVSSDDEEAKKLWPFLDELFLPCRGCCPLFRRDFHAIDSLSHVTAGRHEL